MYEEVVVEIIYFQDNIVRTSLWSDDNAGDDGWT